MIKSFVVHLFCASILAFPAAVLAEEVLATAKFDAAGIAHWKVARDERDRDPGYTFETDSENPATGVMSYTFQVDDSGKQLEGAREIKSGHFVAGIEAPAGTEVFLRATLRCSQPNRKVRFLILDAAGQTFTTEPQPVSDTPSDILFSLNKFSSIAGGSAEQISWPVRVVTFQSVWWGGASENPPEKIWIQKIELVKGA